MCDALIFMNAGTVIHDGNMEDLVQLGKKPTCLG